ncbi:thioesterase-like superfamily-domain-containing protein [Suillus clintonianus]|uniref:thioesterase-like superfamily-domain-containing protein n=1 Tax=Suillus clintonianus TaxID=1904413 RepID=UPI001B878415|nr:thioesterase-like superfamily-domain-containing protein [Suillus clintonianus]KAG2151440.1 thioesterase-like superfamily-domain-containing protein [Suillus clintonianus]
MVPLVRALDVSETSRCSGAATYATELDSSWVIGIPQGGYSLGQIVEACTRFQSETAHKDPIHVTAHFLRATNVGPAEVRVSVQKIGKNFTNLSADLVQGGDIRLLSHLIFGDLTPVPGGIPRSLAPPSPYARRLPLHNHPSAAVRDGMRRAWKFHSLLDWSIDRSILSRNAMRSQTRADTEIIGGGGVEWGAWCELTRTEDEIKPSSIPFFGDMFRNLPSLLPDSEPASQGTSDCWFPTVTMTVEFKARIPSSQDYASRTVGLYSESRFLTDPHGRHNAHVEVWTAPSAIGQGNLEAGWRDKQYCIAVVDQMALTVSMEINHRQGSRREVITKL